VSDTRCYCVVTTTAVASQLLKLQDYPQALPNKVTQTFTNPCCRMSDGNRNSWHIAAS